MMVDPLFSLIAVAAAVTLAVLVLWLKGERGRAEAQAKIDQLTQIAGSLDAANRELAGRLGQLADSQARATAQLTKSLEERLDAVSQRLGEGLEKSATTTAKTIGELQTRLTVIDEAQKHISELSGQVIGLQDILANKQARGAFGEIQLNAIVQNALPPSAYEFQTVLSNNRRADCLIKLPNPPGAIVIDAKFPLESYQALRNAPDDGARAAAARQFAADVLRHVAAIAERYIIAGETAESALMFLPSEAVYAELHASFQGVMEKAYAARVWIVSPTTLMATLNTVRAVLKDAQMREQAHVIQREVGLLLADVGRLDDRVGKLQTHFAQAEQDLKQIGISTAKITSRAERIEAVELEDPDALAGATKSRPTLVVSE
ncbi:MAG: DNA recombination protein RmuC [Proteobacteria bacterium]|nr:MAG: DNA recombination protein RmuC [Pseudomonadota bacterium]